MALLEAKDRVNQFEEALHRLDSVKKHLNTNAADIKAEINSHISRSVECLQAREADLYQHVSRILTTKEERLHRQQARLKQALDVLRTGLALVQDDAAPESQLAETLQRLKQIELSPEETPYISFRGEHVQLRDCILHYGRVDANGLPLMTAFHDPGKPAASLPRHLEEYEDADHHLFYKTVQDTTFDKAMMASTSINVAIPKLSTRLEDWLLRKEAPPAANVPERIGHNPSAIRPSKLGPGFQDSPKSRGSTPGSSCSLNSWLATIKQHTDQEEEHDFEIVDNSFSRMGKSAVQDAKGSKSVPSDFFGHISKDPRQWLLEGCRIVASEPGQNFFSHIAVDPKMWLAYQQLSSLEELPRPDLFAHITKDQDTWLRTRAHNKHQSASETATISGVTTPVGAREVTSGEGASEVTNSEAVSDTASLSGGEAVMETKFFSHISTDLDQWLFTQKPLMRQWPGLEDKDRWLLQSTSISQPVSAAANLATGPWLMQPVGAPSHKTTTITPTAATVEWRAPLKPVSDPCWLFKAPQVVVADDPSLWLSPRPCWEASPTDSDGMDSWSVCSSTLSRSSDQQAQDVAMATQYYNKWLLSE